MQDNLDEKHNLKDQVIEAKINQAIDSINPDIDFVDNLKNRIIFEATNSINKENIYKNKLSNFNFMFQNIYVKYAASAMLILTLIAVIALTLFRIGSDSNKIYENQVADEADNTVLVEEKEISQEELVVTSKELDITDWSAYTIERSDGVKINKYNIRYPSNWTLTLSNAGNTITILSPDGDAWGFDYTTTDWTACVDKKAESIFINDSFFRYFDDETYQLTNWFVCSEKGSTAAQDSYIVTYYAKNNAVLPQLDAISNTITVSSVKAPATSTSDTGDAAGSVYKNAKYNFSVDIPANWTVTEIQDGNSPLIASVKQKDTQFVIYFIKMPVDHGAGVIEYLGDPYIDNQKVTLASGQEVNFEEFGYTYYDKNYFDFGRSAVTLSDGTKIWVVYEYRSNLNDHIGNFDELVRPILESIIIF